MAKDISILAKRKNIAVVGAGIGGLVSALKLSNDGYQVKVFESSNYPGGKIRTLDCSSGPVNIGPTVLTMLSIFQNLFEEVGENIFEHLELKQQKILARHWWSDGTEFDLLANKDDAFNEVRRIFGSNAGEQFIRFFNSTEKMFDCFEKPIMKSSSPAALEILKEICKNPKIITALIPFLTLNKYLESKFSEPKLQQLFGRYSTYVGGSPLFSPALMSLVWQAEARGVWTVKGGISAVAKAIEKLAIDRGVEFVYGRKVVEIKKSNFLVNELCLDDGTCHAADAVVFNGDPRALAVGLLGNDLKNIADKTRNSNRSLSANVWGFEANAINKNLVHHNVFFSDEVNSEFYAIEKGQIPLDPTLYICAQDREETDKKQKTERFEIILNAPPLSKRKPNKKDFEICKSVTLERFKNFGLNFQVDLERRNLTTPKDFNDLFPATEGSLYGQSPHGMMATFQRPKCVTSIANLFLVGGGVHPGAGVPMATLSALLAVEEMKTSQILI